MNVEKRTIDKSFHFFDIIIKLCYFRGMISYLEYNGILMCLYAGVFVIFIIIFSITGLQSAYVSFLNASFGIYEVPNDGKEMILDIYGSRVDFLTNKRLGMAVKVLVNLCFYIISLVFINGCILSTTILSLSSICPMASTSDCFSFESTASINFKPFYCPSNEPVSVTNITADLIICYTWKIKTQTIISILNQLGICSSILLLIGLFFKSLYYLARHKYWETLLTIAFGLAIVIIPVILWTVFGIIFSFILLFLSCLY